MAVPAHDTRDFEFARTFNLPVVCIIEPDPEAAKAENVDVEAVHRGEACWTGEGKLIHSSNGDGLKLDGLSVAESKPAATRWLEERGLGREAVKYKLRDWLFSRQRYWGEPFPIIHYEDGSIELVNSDELPVDLPEMEDFKPAGDGEPPLSKAKDWLNYTDPKTGRRGKRETNTMPQWAGSCWYYLRYIDPDNAEQAWDPAKEKYWMPVDLYVGGAEHAVLHLLYARFWHKVLFDLGLVSTKEPFRKLINQGMILGVSYKDRRGALVPTDQVEFTPAGPVRKSDGEALVEFPAKMSKSLRNVINPDDVIREYGADSMRMYEMFMGPLEATKPWSTKGVEGVYRVPETGAPHVSGSRNRRCPLHEGSAAAAARDNQEGFAGSGQFRLQYRDQPAHDFPERVLEARQAAARGGGNVRASAVAVRAASRRRTLAAARPRKHAGL